MSSTADERRSGSGSTYRNRRSDYGELNPHTVQGRIGRLRFVAWGMVAQLVLFGLVIGVGPRISNAMLGMVFMVPVVLVAFLYMIRFMAQRLHDIGFSAWFMLVTFIPVIGQIAILVLFFWPGNSAENDYGDPPPPNGTMVYLLALLFPLVLGGGIWKGEEIGLYLAHKSVQNSAGLSEKDKQGFDKMRQMQELAIKIQKRGGQPTVAEQQKMERLMKELQAEQGAPQRR